MLLFKQTTAYEMRISDWSSEVCSSDLSARGPQLSAREDTSTLWQLGSLHRLTKIDLVLVVLAPRGSPLSWFGRFSDRPRRLTCLFGRANHLVLDLTVLCSLRCTVHCLSPRPLRLSACVRRSEERRLGKECVGSC